MLRSGRIRNTKLDRMKLLILCTVQDLSPSPTAIALKRPPMFTVSTFYLSIDQYLLKINYVRGTVLDTGKTVMSIHLAQRTRYMLLLFNFFRSFNPQSDYKPFEGNIFQLDYKHLDSKVNIMY